MRSNKSIKEGKKEIIIDLRNKGYSYRQIRNETGISNGSISYHAGEGQKEKTIERSERQRKGFKRKVWNFIWGERRKTPKKPFVYGTTEIRKKGREFIYGDKRRKAGQNMKIKKPKIWIYFGKLFPGITSKEKEVQAVNQWTGELDYYDNGKPIMFPFLRGKLTGEIVNIEGNNIHVDHVDGDKTNNTIENFTLVKDCANQLKSDAPSYKILFERIEKVRNTLLKHRDVWDG